VEVDLLGEVGDLLQVVELAWLRLLWVESLSYLFFNFFSSQLSIDSFAGLFILSLKLLIQSGSLVASMPLLELCFSPRLLFPLFDPL